MDSLANLVPATPLLDLAQTSQRPAQTINQDRSLAAAAVHRPHVSLGFLTIRSAIALIITTHAVIILTVKLMRIALALVANVSLCVVIVALCHVLQSASLR